MGNERGAASSLLLIVGAIVLLGVGVLIGVLVDGDESHSANEALQAGSIGNPSAGRELFVSQGCVMCHTYQGRGGSDAPNLEFMKGKLTATDIANMSGTIWNHLPAMKAAFEEEEIPFPTFTGDEMANLIAYLHGGGPPPDIPEGAMEEHGEEGEQGGAGMHEESGERMHSEGSGQAEESGHSEQGEKAAKSK